MRTTRPATNTRISTTGSSGTTISRRYIAETYKMLKNHKWYMEPRLVTVNDLYAFDPNAKVSIDPFQDIIGRHFKQPKEGLGYDNSPSAHMWRTLAGRTTRSRASGSGSGLRADEKVFAGFSFRGLLAVVASGQAASKAQPLPGLDATVTKVERAASASLRDCPPGSNTVNAVTRPGRAFALVTVAFKVSPSFKSGADEAADGHRRRGQEIQHRVDLRRRWQRARILLHLPVPGTGRHEAEVVAD